MTNFERAFCILMRYTLPEGEILAIASMEGLELALNGQLEQMITDAMACTGVAWNGFVPEAALQACIDTSFVAYDGFGQFN